LGCDEDADNMTYQSHIWQLEKSIVIKNDVLDKVISFAYWIRAWVFTTACSYAWYVIAMQMREINQLFA
jgi:hypothetical protein